jgi:hypothetical protein
MKEENQELFNVVFTALRNKEKKGIVINLPIIKDETKKFLSIYPEADENIVNNELETHFTIAMGKSETLYKNKTPWIKAYKQENPNPENFPFWSNYKQYLKEELKYPSNVIDEIDESTDAIFDGMSNPKKNISFEKKGMVIGYVQSGKTGNYVGLINKGIDLGYNFIVVLAGLHNNLRQQTQFRIDQGVNGIQRMNGQQASVGVGKLHNRFTDTHTQTLTTSDLDGDFKTNARNMTGINFALNAPLIAVIKKNVTPLKNLNKWLEDIIGINNQTKSNKAVLIIDDECDQASINNNFKIDDLKTPIPDEDGNVDNENTPSKINEQINLLLNKFKRRGYVGYTATPYANVFIPIDNEVYKDIFPEDFIVRLDQPSNYLGPEKYFGYGEDEIELPGMLEVDKIEDFMSQVKAFKRKDIKELEIPESLKTAAKLFIISGAIRLYRGQENSHMSMLIHASHLTEVQNEIGKQFRKYWNELRDNLLIINHSGSWNDIKNIYEGKYNNGLNEIIPNQKYFTDRFSENEAFKTNNFELPKKIEDIFDKIRSFIAAIDIVVINSDKNNKKDSLNYHLYPSGRKVIAIGGNTMSRGLTLEGLHTSYFLRHAGAFDTLMQMGRWFGYRPNYSDLCKIITTEDIITDFGEICLADLKMKSNISAMIRNNSSPRDFLIQVRQSSTSLAITTKMGASGTQRVSWSGGETITKLISRKKEIIKSNHELLINLLNKTNEEHKPIVESNKIIFKALPLSVFEKYIKGYLLVNNDGSLDLNGIIEYYKVCRFDKIDLVVLGRKIGTNENNVNYSFAGNEIGLAERESEKPEDKDFFKVIRSKLTDADYLSHFIKEELTEKEKKTPSIVCAYLKRPVITFLAMNPKYFFLNKKLEEKEIPSEDNVFQELINEYGGISAETYNVIPYGLSIATPSKSINGNLIEENVLINITVQQNIENQ